MSVGLVPYHQTPSSHREKNDAVGRSFIVILKLQIEIVKAAWAFPSRNELLDSSSHKETRSCFL